jgi:hypothetical protein
MASKPNFGKPLGPLSAEERAELGESPPPSNPSSRRSSEDEAVVIKVKETPAQKKVRENEEGHNLMMKAVTRMGGKKSRKRKGKKARKTRRKH